MAALVAAFIDGVLSVEHFSGGGNRRLAIRHKITESENILRRDREAAEAIHWFLELAKDRVFEQMFRHTLIDIATPTAEFFHEVFDELSVRIRLNIRELRDDTVQVMVHVIASGGARSESVKTEFRSIEDAQQWIDSDEGNALIHAVIEKYEK